MKMNVKELLEEIRLQQKMYMNANGGKSPDNVMIHTAWKDELELMHNALFTRLHPQALIRFADMLIVWTNGIPKNRVVCTINCNW